MNYRPTTMMTSTKSYERRCPVKGDSENLNHGGATHTGPLGNSTLAGVR